VPTYGWVREDDLEAFYEATERLRDLGPPPSPMFRCPFCADSYAERTDLQNHVSDEHKVERPALLIQGREPSLRTTIRSKLMETDLVIANATSATICINGDEVSDSSLEAVFGHLSQHSNAEAKVTLLNDTQKNATPIATVYNLSLRVATDDELRDVERAFADVIMCEQVSREGIGRFLADVRTSGSASEYAVGLAEYALGVLLKERPDTEPLSTPYARYREAYGAALQKLIDFQRPLASLISDIIRFAMNDFSNTSEKTGFWELDLARSLLKDPEENEIAVVKDQDEMRKPICPVDHGTGQILALAERMFGQERWGPILDEECRKATASEILDAMDRQKAMAIWAASAWRLNAKNSAIEPLRQISATYPFSNWAEPYLESLNK
jgi:hypothetical protein